MQTPKLKMLEGALRRLMRREAAYPLERIVEKTRAADLAYLLTHFSESERIRLIEACSGPERRSQVLAAASADLAAKIIDSLPAERSVALLQRLEPDDASDILGQMDEARAQSLLQRMRSADRTQVEELSRYDEATAGGIMSPRFFALNRDISAGQAIEHLQRVSDDLEMAFYVYVVNEVGQLLGVLSLRQLVTTKPETGLFDLMCSDVISVKPEDDQEAVAELVSRYGLLAVPVVNDSNKLVGIVTVDDVMDVLREEATEDILRMAGAGDELNDDNSIGRSVLQRLPWTGAVAIGGLICGLLLRRYSALGKAFIPLALLLPLVLALGGLIALQSSAVIAQNMQQGLGGRNLASEMMRQVANSTILGALFGSLTSVAILAWPSPLWDTQYAGHWLGLGVTCATIVASMLGAGLPAIFERVGLDPALASGPIGTVFVDIGATAVYLWVGSQIG